MRIVIDCHMVAQPEAGDAGNARYTASLHAAMRRTAGRGDEVEALISHEDAADLLEGPRRFVAPSGARRLLRDAPRALRDSRADVGVFNYVAPPRPGTATAVVVHDASFVHDPQWLSGSAARMLRLMVPRAVAGAAVVLSVSQTAADDVAASLGLDPGAIRVVPNYAADCFTPDGPAGEVAARHGLDRFVLAVGDIGPRKNLAALAEAVAMLATPGLELAVVGRGPRSGLDGHRVRFLGHLPDDELAALYRCATVVGAPSLYEGFGLPLLEAMACGAPTVASERGAHREVAGDGALLVPPTARGLAEGIRAALEPATAERLSRLGPVAAARFGAEDSGRRAWRALREAVS